LALTPQTSASATPPAAFRIRPARRGDAEAIASLLGELGYPGGCDAATMNWVISHPEAEIIVAGDSMDRAIGVLSLSHRPQLRMKGRIASIDELVVTAAWRRRGVGRELIRRALERSKVLSVKRLEILTHPGHTTSNADPSAAKLGADPFEPF
jgi:N-acetylglutamate synthase-like GNAT family acetyltransferase